MIIHTFNNIYHALKPDGHLIVRDWDNTDADKYKCIESYQGIIKTNKIPEVARWAGALYKNAITETDIDISHTPLFIRNELYRKTGTIYACGADFFELMFHTIWGEASLARESEEKYDTSCAIEKYLLRQHDDLKLVKTKEEYDESFLPELYNRADFDMFNIASFAFCSFDNITPGTENSYGFYKSKDNKYILEQLMF